MASLHGLYIVNSTLEILGGFWKDKILIGFLLHSTADVDTIQCLWREIRISAEGLNMKHVWYFLQGKVSMWSMHMIVANLSFVIEIYGTYYIHHNEAASPILGPGLLYRWVHLGYKFRG